jgi:hypothetical protein
MAQQTAVDWLIHQYKEQGKLYLKDIEQAKEMEREQIINAHGRGTVEHSGFPSPMTSEEYYTKTYQQ